MFMFRKKLQLTYLSLLFLMLAAKPAFADVPMGYGIRTAAVPFTISLATWGIAGILIIAIESWFFRRYWHFSMLWSIWFTIWINLFSTVIGGFISVFMFSSGLTGLFCLIMIPLFFIGLSIHCKSPLWFTLVTIIGFIVGSFAAASVNGLVDTLPGFQLLLVIEIPLLTGFSLTLWFESIAITNRSEKKDFWLVITKANVASYILLIFLFPFFAPNPYAVNNTEYVVPLNDYHTGLDDKATNPERAIEYFRLRRSSTPQLLGLSDPAKPPDNYGAAYEISYLENQILSPYSSHSSSPRDRKAISEDTLKLSTLTPEALEKLHWLDQFNSYLVKAVEMIYNNDQDGLNRVYNDWVTWQTKTGYPKNPIDIYNYDSFIRFHEDDDNFRMLGDFPHPSFLISDIIWVKQSKLIPPGWIPQS